MRQPYATTPASATEGNVGHAPAHTASVPADTFKAAPDAAQYPAKANPAGINHLMTVVLLWAPRHRRDDGSRADRGDARRDVPSVDPLHLDVLPRHIGNGWFDGLLPTTSFMKVAAKGNVYSGQLYPIVIAAVTFVIAALFLRETKDVISTPTTDHNTARPAAAGRVPASPARVSAPSTGTEP